MLISNNIILSELPVTLQKENSRAPILYRIWTKLQKQLLNTGIIYKHFHLAPHNYNNLTKDMIPPKWAQENTLIA